MASFVPKMPILKRQQRIIWLEILGKRQNIIIGIVYRHPHYNIDEFSQSLCETITKIAKNNYAYYVLGDININLLNATNDSRIQQYIDTLCSLGCYPIINKPTRVVNEAETCIDHIYTNNISTEINPYTVLCCMILVITIQFA